ncbi:MAG: glycosyltransferase family 4 protein [Actinobacteria bacterium]|nr:glycosyltransferase family 4 protein [Actinomycetota bacterium]
MDPLTVLQIHNRYREAGGEDVVTSKERALLREAGHEVIDYQVENPRGPVAATASLLVSPWNPMSARRVGDAVRRHRPDVAHIHNTWWALSPSIVRSLSKAGVPTVMTLHNYRLVCANGKLFRDGEPCEDCVGTHPWRAVGHGCYRGSVPASIMAAAAIELPRRLHAWQGVDLFLPLTDFARERFIAGGLSSDKLWVKPNFVDDPGPRRVRPSESGVVLFVGRLSAEKGIEVLLDAWRNAAPRRLELVVVGDGPLRQALEASPPAGVRFLGRQPVDQVRELMLGARAMAFPSLWFEGQPMVLLEALAAGVPLVVSALGGIPDTVADGRAALAVPAGDRSAWAAALGRLAGDDWLDAASGYARRVFESRYSPHLALDALEEAYRRAMGDRGH